jgi:hypothetical protein
LPAVICARSSNRTLCQHNPTRQGRRLGEDAFAKLLSVLESLGGGAIAGPFSGRTCGAPETLHSARNSPYMMKNFLNDGLPCAGIHCAACACIWWTPLSCGGAGIGLDAGWWQRRVCCSWQWSHGDAPIGRPAAAVDSGPRDFGSVAVQPRRQLDVDVEDRVIHGDLANVGLLRNHSMKTRSR